MTPSRTSTQPARASLKPAPTLLMAAPKPVPGTGTNHIEDRKCDAASKLPARMKRGNTAGIVAEGNAVEARVGDHGSKVLLVGEFRDRFNQIGIGLAIAGDHPADPGNGIERPGFIGLVEQRHLDLRKFQAQEPAAW